MKSFEDIINGDVNEGLAEKWRHAANNTNNPSNYLICQMLLSAMEKLDEIDKKVTKFPYGDTAP